MHPIDIISTYLGAHSVPKGSTAALATEDIINNQIPALKVSLKLENIVLNIIPSKIFRN